MLTLPRATFLYRIVLDCASEVVILTFALSASAFDVVATPVVVDLGY